ncbi:MAG TPA: cobalamin biosynthesis protein [Alphaproteobacteria bacterium]|nr:cobalamin biosynthesis protein [Alphaproteobacteria bacterium]
MLDRLAGLNPDFSLVALVQGPVPLVLLVLALFTDAVAGSVLRALVPLPHPDRIVAALSASLERRLNREHRSAATRLIRGLLATLVILAVGVGLGAAIAALGAAVPFGWVLTLTVILALVSQHRPAAALRTARALGPLGNLGRETLDHDFPVLSGGDEFLAAASRDSFAVARGAVEHLAGRFSAGLVGCVFWYVLFGLPGLVVYRFVNVMASRLDETKVRGGNFGLVATRLHEAMAWLPARFAGALLALAAVFVPGAHAGRTFATMLAQAPRHPVRSLAWPVAAMAGALGLSLAGPDPIEDRGGALVPWIGPERARARVNAIDIRRAVFLYAVAVLLNGVVLLLVTMAWLAA